MATPEASAPMASATRPYFPWWTDLTEAGWLGALLREAHTADVWRLTTPSAVRAQWPQLVRHLGQPRDVGLVAADRTTGPGVATFDRRIVRPSTLRFLQACHARTPFHLAGGAALAGVHLR